MAMAVSELEAAVAALPGKRDALREAYDRLAACSPSPLPFAWEDLDAHLSSLQASIALRFRQFQVLEAARTAPADAALGGTRRDRRTGILEVEEEEEMQGGDYYEADDKIGNDGKEEKEVMEGVGEVEEVPHDKFSNEIKDVELAMEEQASEMDEQDADEEMQVADEVGPNTKDAFKASPDKEEQDTNMDVTVANKASAMLGKEEEDTSLEQEQDTNMDQMADTKASAMLGNEEEEASMEKEQSTNMDEMAAKEASAGHGRQEEASMEEEQDTSMGEMMAKKVSAVQGKEVEACSEKQEGDAEEHGAHEVEEYPKNATKGEGVVAKEVSRDQGNQALPNRFNDRTTACTSMDAQRLFKLICTGIKLNSEVQDAVRHAPDAAALALQVVELFLHNKKLNKTKKVWANCVGLIEMVPVAVTKPSTDTIEQAKRVARDWKKMIGNPGSRTVLGNLASWGLLYFLISYNTVSEFDTKEIFHLFGTIPRKKWSNSAVLIKAIGLTDRIPELMDYLIENGQQKYVLYLARVLKLVDKYSPLSLLKGCVERAEQIATKICEKNMTHQSLLAVIIKEIDNLERAHDLAKQEITDSSLYTSISAEIFVLLDEFVEKKRSLANASTASTSNSQQQQIENKKRKKVQQQKHHKGQESQQQGQASKLREELAKKRTKPRQEQQQKQEDKPKEEQQQKQEDKPKEEQQQKQEDTPNEKQQNKNKQKCTKRNQASSAVRGMAPGGHFGYPPYTTMHHHGYPAPPVWPGNHFAAPFVPQLGGPGYIGPVNPFYSRPEFCPW